MEENKKSNNPKENEWQQMKDMMAGREESKAKDYAEQELRKRRLSKILRMTSFVILALTITSFVYYFGLDYRKNFTDIYSLSNQITVMDSTTKSLVLKTQKLEFEFSLQPNLLNDTISNIKLINEIDLDNILNQIQELRKNLNEINSVIIDNPNKILTVPLLKKDLENLIQSNEKEHFEFEQMIQQSESNLILFFGLLFAFIAGLVTLGVSIILNMNPKENNGN